MMKPKYRIHTSEKNLRVRLVDGDGREIYNVGCINPVHYYCVRFAIEQFLRGVPGDMTCLKLGTKEPSTHTGNPYNDEAPSENQSTKGIS